MANLTPEGILQDLELAGQIIGTPIFLAKNTPIDIRQILTKEQREYLDNYKLAYSGLQAWDSDVLRFYTYFSSSNTSEGKWVASSLIAEVDSIKTDSIKHFPTGTILSWKSDAYNIPSLYIKDSTGNAVSLGAATVQLNVNEIVQSIDQNTTYDDLNTAGYKEVDCDIFYCQTGYNGLVRQEEKFNYLENAPYVPQLIKDTESSVGTIMQGILDNNKHLYDCDLSTEWTLKYYNFDGTSVIKTLQDLYNNSYRVFLYEDLETGKYWYVIIEHKKWKLFKGDYIRVCAKECKKLINSCRIDTLKNISNYSLRELEFLNVPLPLLNQEDILVKSNFTINDPVNIVWTFGITIHDYYNKDSDHTLVLGKKLYTFKKSSDPTENKLFLVMNDQISIDDKDVLVDNYDKIFHDGIFPCCWEITNTDSTYEWKFFNNINALNNCSMTYILKSGEKYTSIYWQLNNTNKHDGALIKMNWLQESPLPYDLSTYRKNGGEIAFIGYSLDNQPSTEQKPISTSELPDTTLITDSTQKKCYQIHKQSRNDISLQLVYNNQFNELSSFQDKPIIKTNGAQVSLEHDIIQYNNKIYAIHRGSKYETINDQIYTWLEEGIGWQTWYPFETSSDILRRNLYFILRANSEDQAPTWSTNYLEEWDDNYYKTYFLENIFKGAIDMQFAHKHFKQPSRIGQEHRTEDEIFYHLEFGLSNIDYSYQDKKGTTINVPTSGKSWELQFNAYYNDINIRDDYNGDWVTEGTYPVNSVGIVLVYPKEFIAWKFKSNTNETLLINYNQTDNTISYQETYGNNIIVECVPPSELGYESELDENNIALVIYPQNGRFIYTKTFSYKLVNQEISSFDLDLSAGTKIVTNNELIDLNDYDNEVFSINFGTQNVSLITQRDDENNRITCVAYQTNNNVINDNMIDLREDNYIAYKDKNNVPQIKKLSELVEENESLVIYKGDQKKTFKKEQNILLKNEFAERFVVLDNTNNLAYSNTSNNQLDNLMNNVEQLNQQMQQVENQLHNNTVVVTRNEAVSPNSKTFTECLNDALSTGTIHSIPVEVHRKLKDIGFIDTSTLNSNGSLLFQNNKKSRTILDTLINYVEPITINYLTNNNQNIHASIDNAIDSGLYFYENQFWDTLNNKNTLTKNQYIGFVRNTSLTEETGNFSSKVAQYLLGPTLRFRTGNFVSNSGYQWNGWSEYNWEDIIFNNINQNSVSLSASQLVENFIREDVEEEVQSDRTITTTTTIVERSPITNLEINENKFYISSKPTYQSSIIQEFTDYTEADIESTTTTREEHFSGEYSELTLTPNEFIVNLEHDTPMKLEFTTNGLCINDINLLTSYVPTTYRPEISPVVSRIVNNGSIALDVSRDINTSSSLSVTETTISLNSQFSTSSSTVKLTPGSFKYNESPILTQANFNTIMGDIGGGDIDTSNFVKASVSTTNTTGTITNNGGEIVLKSAYGEDDEYSTANISWQNVSLSSYGQGESNFTMRGGTIDLTGDSLTWNEDPVITTDTIQDYIPDTSQFARVIDLTAAMIISGGGTE